MEIEEGEEAEEAKESKMHRLLNLKKIYWRAKRQLLQIQRKADLRLVEKRLQFLRQRRAERRRTVGGRRKRCNREVDRPRRGTDSCWGCARPFFAQRVRHWQRCEACGLWLCPDCSAQPVHCQNDPFKVMYP